MKVIDIFEGDVDTSFVDRMKQKEDKKQETKDIITRQKYKLAVHDWYNKKIQPLMTKLFNARSFGINNIEELEKYISDTVYEPNAYKINDVMNYSEFKKAVDNLDKQQRNRLYHIRKNSSDFVNISKEIYHLTEEWLDTFRPDKGKTFFALSVYIDPKQRDQLSNWHKTFHWLLFLRKYFPNK